MKRKKLIAGVSAGILAIVSSATSVSAFADEINLVQEQKELQTYVDSFAAEDENLYEIATYLSDNDFSLEETKQIMERCENSQDEMAETVAAQASGTTYFHNENHINDITQCYLFMRGPYYGEPNLRVDIKFPTGLILSTDNMSKNPYIASSKNTDDISIRKGSTIYDFYYYAFDTISVGVGESATLMSFDVPNKVTTLPSEKALMQNIKATYNSTDKRNATSTSFATGCYYLGDLNHDGNVDDVDATFLVKYLNGSVSLGGSYYDVTPHEATFLRTMAADVNRDGKVDNADLVRLNQYLAGLVYPL